MNILEIPDLTEGFMMLIIGMGVVFGVLLLLFVCFNQLKRIAGVFDKPSNANSTDKSKESAPKVTLTGDVNAAISLALYLYLNEQHDHESEVVTIKTMQRRYSPWSSKIYGLNILKK